MPVGASGVTYCISGPHRNRRRSHRNHHTPSGRRCSGGLHTQTGWTYKICLQRRTEGIYCLSPPLPVVFPCGMRSWKKNCVFKNIRGRCGGRLTAVCLIGSVLTVVLLITRPAHWNAAATRAGEEVDGTFELSLVCKRSGEERKLWQTSSKKPGKSAGADLGSSSRPRSPRSRCCRHTPRRTDSTELFSHSSGRTHLSLPDGRNENSRWILKGTETSHIKEAQ